MGRILLDDFPLFIVLISEELKLFTRDQKLRYLVDDAIFSESLNTRIKAVNQMIVNYGLNAIPVIEQILDILPVTDKEFKTLCKNMVDKVRGQKRYT
jgi:hypothetical protein